MEFEILVCMYMYGIPNCGFKKDDLNIYFSAYDSFSCFFTDSPMSVHVCIVHCSEVIHVDYIRPTVHTTYMLFDPRVTLYVPMHTCYSTHTYMILFSPHVILFDRCRILFNPHGTLHIHYMYPHGTLINIRIHLREYE